MTTFLFGVQLSPLFNFCHLFYPPSSHCVPPHPPTRLLCFFLLSFSRLHFLAPTIVSPAGCKMDSLQSDLPGKGQKAEENRTQGELQRGRHSAVLSRLSLSSVYFLLFNVSPFILWRPFSFLAVVAFSLNITVISFFFFFIEILFVGQHGFP